MTSTTLREMLVKQEPRCVSTCFVCAGSRAEYVISSKPYGDNPFFPFLEQHQPPDGAEPMRSDGRVWVCNVCYSFLNQQWNTYEKSKTPFTKRLYWLKRLDNGPFAGMDLNLQQDYESLFEASSSGAEVENRKVKQPRNQFPTNVMKAKSSEFSDSTFPSAFGFQIQGSEKPGPVGSNILDLSVSTRTSSRSSSSASPGMSCEACYLCGHESKSFSNVYINAIPHCPFFPSLRTHVKPMKAKPIDVDSSIHVCKQCHSSLLNQWDYFQKQGIPHQDRIYKTSSIMSNEIPAKDRTFVCYTCGMVTQLSVQRFINAFQEKGEPFFSFLLQTNPHPGANKLSSGKACVCSVCYKSLFRQYRVYEVSNTPEERRKYKILNESVSNNGSVLRQHLESVSQDLVESKLVCYLCENLSESFISVSTVPTDDMYFPFIRSFPKPANAIPIDIQGQVKVCNQCHSSLRYQWQAFEHASIPINQRQYKVPISKSQEIETQHLSSYASGHPTYSNVEEHIVISKRGLDKCSLCERPFSEDSVYFLETLPREKSMHFPSLHSLVKQSNCIDQYGRIPSCNQCYTFLKNQWEIFESAHVPHSQRQYEICPTKSEHAHHYTGESRLSEASAALHIQVSSPDLKIDLTKHSSNEPLLTTVNTMPVSSITLTNAPISGLDKSADLKLTMKQNPEGEPVTRISGPLDVPYVRPLLLVPINCFVCGEFNSTGLTYAIKSQPTSNSKNDECVPFFPFLSKHSPPEGSEKLANDGSALVCMFCYHSLMSQWYAYQFSPYSEDENPWLRRYNTHNYVCFICGITTYRKRVCSISVKNFPFLLEHKRPNGALALLNGDCVVTCQTCFESITSQWKDFERMKVPIEMRRYNWIVLPAPPDDENSRGCQILQENSGSASNLQLNENEQANLDESGIPHGLKPNPSHLGVPTPYGLPKSVSHNMMSPVHQNSSSHPNTAFSPFPGNSNHALNATRASSFAAALRKLAKQAVDPIAEKELSPISPASSPASSQHSNHSRHHAPMPLYMNSHNSNPPGHGSPTPITVTQGKALDMARYSNSSRNGNIVEPVSLKMESSKMMSSGNDKRNEVKHVPPPTMPHNMRQENNLSRGFQPYRNSDERHPTPPHMYNPSPPPNTMSGYTYHHPSLVQSSRMPPQSYRLEDSVYMERYGLLRPSTMPYPPPSTNVMPHTRNPHYSPSQYPPELISQSMRLAPSNSSACTSSRYNQEEENVKDSSNLLLQREMEIYRERERYLEREEAESREREAEYFRKERSRIRQSPVPQPHSTSRGEANEDKGHMGSIIHGTPRDYVRNLPPAPAASGPLNLATNVPQMEAPLALKEDYNSRHLRPNSSALVNGQVHQRNANHHSGMSYYRKEPDMNSHRVQYQMTVSRETEPKQPLHIESVENKAPAPPRSKTSYFMDRENNKNSNTFETRTLSMASVINSQINGIFAREKFPSNNSFDYLNSFVAKSEEPSPESKHKSEPDFRLSPRSQESFTSTSRDSIGEKPSAAESLKSEPLNSKLPSYLFNAPPTLFRCEPSEYPDSYKLKDLSSSRAPPQILEAQSSHESAEEKPRIISVLDAREERLRKLRLIREVTESEESDIETDEDDEEKIKILLTIKKGPRPKMDSDPNKLKFLSKVNLITHSKKQAIELRKCIKRHQMLREKSLSPVDMKPAKAPDIEYDVEHLNELAKRLCFEEDFQHKTEFFKSLKLDFVSAEQKEDKEKIEKVILQDKLRRNGQLKGSKLTLQSPGTLLGKRDYSVLNNVKSEVVKKPNLNQELNVQNLSSNPSFGDKKLLSLKDMSQPLPTLQKKVSAFLKPPMKTVNLPVPPLIPTNQISTFTEPAQDKGVSIASKDPRVRQINKDFVQEFHNSVLQTTQMQLEKKNNSTLNLVENTLYKVPEDEIVEKSELYPMDRPIFRWPGIEALMESYECHISEQTAEKKFLVESCQRLKTVNQESNFEVECLQKKTEELKQEKLYLDSERRELQNRIENLKMFIEHFR